MSNHLEHLARRLEDDSFFLACPLRLYAKSEGLSDDGLAARLKCSTESLVSVLLCRAPSVEDNSFYEGIERIAAKFSVNAETLAEAVRRGQAIFDMARAANTSNTLLAARDNDAKSAGAQTNGGFP
jgi:hypothetical protein